MNADIYADIAASAIMKFKAKVGGRYYPGYHEDMRDSVKKAILAAEPEVPQSGDLINRENRVRND